MFSEVAEIAWVAVGLGQFQQILKTRVILTLNFTHPHVITYTNKKNIVLKKEQNKRFCSNHIIPDLFLEQKNRDIFSDNYYCLCH